MFGLLQVTRFVAAVLVLGRHTQLLFGLPKYFDYHPLAGLFSGGVLGVDFFFVLSGFIILYAHWNDVGKPSRVANYLKRRIQRVYPIYWVVAIIVLATLKFTPSSYSHLIGDPIYLVRNFLLLPQNDPFVQVAWTLQHEIAFYAVFAMLIVNRTLGICVLGAWFLASGVGWGPASPSADVLADHRHIEFLFGMIVAFLVCRQTIPAPGWLLALGSLAFAVCVYVGGPVYGDLTRSGAPNLTIVVGLASALIIGSLIELERSRNWHAPAFLRVGPRSHLISAEPSQHQPH